jgi:hypothetical protein
MDFSSAFRSHTWQAAQKYGGTSPIALCRCVSKATRSSLGILKFSISRSFGVEADVMDVMDEVDGILM